MTLIPAARALGEVVGEMAILRQQPGLSSEPPAQEKEECGVYRFRGRFRKVRLGGENVTNPTERWNTVFSVDCIYDFHSGNPFLADEETTTSGNTRFLALTVAKRHQLLPRPAAPGSW